VTLSSYVNAVPVDYHFVLVPSVPVQAKSFLLFTFPEEISLPTSASKLNCENTFKTIVASVKCSYDSSFGLDNTVKVDLTLANGLKQIESMDRFDVKMSGI